MVKKNIKPIDDLAQRRDSQQHFATTLVNRADLHILTQGMYSKNSELAMAADWNRFTQFCLTRHVCALPASVTAIRLFLETESAQRKFSSLRRYSITIGVIHFLHALADPTAHRQIRLTLQHLRTTKHGDARQAAPLNKEHLIQLDKLLRQDNTIRAIRDLAIYYLMFECALKRSELRQMQVSNIQLGNDGYQLCLPNNRYQLSDEAGRALSHWLNMISHADGFLFRRIDKHSNVGTMDLDDSSIYRILRRASDLLMLSNEHRFTGQSARVGAVKALEKQGYPLKEIQAFGRWLSPAMPAQYLDKRDIAEQEKLKFRAIKPWE